MIIRKLHKARKKSIAERWKNAVRSTLENLLWHGVVRAGKILS
jgi:hypothetical protein